MDRRDSEFDPDLVDDEYDEADPDRRAVPGEGLGGVVDEIASSWFFGDALSRLVGAGERVMHAQQSALSALGLPSGSQFESLTLRVRTLFHRIEELEDDLDRIERRVSELEARESSSRERGGASASASKRTASGRAKPKTAKRAG